MTVFRVISTTADAPLPRLGARLVRGVRVAIPWTAAVLVAVPYVLLPLMPAAAFLVWAFGIG